MLLWNELCNTFQQYVTAIAVNSLKGFKPNFHMYKSHIHVLQNTSWVAAEGEEGTVYCHTSKHVISKVICLFHIEAAMCWSPVFWNMSKKKTHGHLDIIQTYLRVIKVIPRCGQPEQTQRRERLNLSMKAEIITRQLEPIMSPLLIYSDITHI